MKKKFTQKIILLLFVCLCSANIVSARGDKNVGNSVISENSIDEITGIYNGNLSINFKGENIFPDQLLLQRDGSDELRLTLRNFAFGPMVLGDIDVRNIPVSISGNEYQFASETEEFSFVGGLVIADVTVTGKVENGNTSIKIDVVWKQGNDDDLPIPVNFTGSKVIDGLRLSNIFINGNSISGGNFDSDIFNYNNMVIEPASVLTYTKGDAASKVNVIMDGNWIYLNVTDGVETNSYKISNPMNMEDMTIAPIKIFTIGQDIDGDLNMSNGSEMIGEVTVAGKITYNKPINGTGWNVVGLPYIPVVKTVKTDGTKADADAYWYSYTSNNGKFEQLRLDAPTFAFIMQLKANTDAKSVDLISPAGSSISKEQIGASEAYTVVGNNTLTSRSVNDIAMLLGSPYYFYVFDGSAFSIVPEDTKVGVGEMYIVFSGSNPPNTIAVPDPSVGVERQSLEDIDVYGLNNEIYINNYTGKVEVYEMNGRKIMDKFVDTSSSFTMTSGVYVVRTGEKATLVMIK